MPIWKYHFYMYYFFIPICTWSVGFGIRWWAPDLNWLCFGIHWWAPDLNWLCFVLHIGHHLWNQKELPVVRVNLGNASSQYTWNGMQMRAVECLVLQLLNLPYRGRDHCLIGTVHKLTHIYNNIRWLLWDGFFLKVVLYINVWYPIQIHCSIWIFVIVK